MHHPWASNRRAAGDGGREGVAGNRRRGGALGGTSLGFWATLGWMRKHCRERVTAAESPEGLLGVWDFPPF